MLKGIDPRIPPELLYALAQMGHGDTIAIVDANFPAHSVGEWVIVSPVSLTDAVQMVLSLMPLDQFVPSAATSMQVVGEPETVPPAIAELTPAVEGAGSKIESVERFDFYDIARDAYVVLQTADTRLYANLILKKGVISPQFS